MRYHQSPSPSPSPESPQCRPRRSLRPSAPDIYDDIGGIYDYDSCDDYNYDSDPADAR